MFKFWILITKFLDVSNFHNAGIQILEQMNAFTMKLSPPHNKPRGVYNNLGFVFTILVQYLSQNYKHEIMMSDIFLNTKTDDTLCTYTATRER